MIKYKNKEYNILAVVPARSGSKEIKNKNIKLVNRIPLIGYTGNYISKIKYIDNAICSTDSKSYANIANKFNLETPFLRPKKLSTDMIGDIPVLKHALIKSEKYYKKHFDLVIMLQPTSPLRKEIDLKIALKYTLENNFDSVWSVSDVDLKNHPHKQLIIKNNKLKFFSKKGNTIIARQQLQKTYQRNGIFYIIKRKLLIRNQYINNNTGHYIVRNKFVNIDTVQDFKKFSKFLKELKL